MTAKGVAVSVRCDVCSERSLYVETALVDEKEMARSPSWWVEPFAAIGWTRQRGYWICPTCALTPIESAALVALRDGPLRGTGG